MLASQKLTVVAGEFNPIYAPMAEEIGKLDAPLLAVVLPRENGYLSARAAAEMAASLRMVRCVVVGPIAEAVDVDFTRQEAQWRKELEATVVRKSKG